MPWGCARENVLGQRSFFKNKGFFKAGIHGVFWGWAGKKKPFFLGIRHWDEP